MPSRDEIPMVPAKLVTIGNAPGYRDAGITVEIVDGGKPRRLELRFSAEDATFLCSEMLGHQSLAWNQGKPLDAKPHEQQRPAWVPKWSIA